jgi:hypothetical protein
MIRKEREKGEKGEIGDLRLRIADFGFEKRDRA